MIFVDAVHYSMERIFSTVSTNLSWNKHGSDWSVSLLFSNKFWTGFVAAGLLTAAVNEIVKTAVCIWELYTETRPDDEYHDRYPKMQS